MQKQMCLLVAVFVLALTSGQANAAFQGSTNSVSSKPATGFAHIANYTPVDYDSHAQNWAVIQGKNGIMYFGNGSDFLSFDGKGWRFFHLPNDRAVRSVAAAETGEMYVGGINELGVVQPDSIGNQTYTSLLDALGDEYGLVGSVWQTFIKDGAVYFRTNEYIFVYEDDSFSVIENESGFHTMFASDDELFVLVNNQGFARISAGQLEILPESNRYSASRFYGFEYAGDGRYLAVFRDEGLFWFNGNTFTEFETEADEFLSENAVYKTLLLPDGNIALGTLYGGVAIINQAGELKHIYDRQSGLQDQTVYDMFTDREGNLWLALNNGISKIRYNSPVSQFDERHGLLGNVMTVIRHNQHLYAGTTEGLFRLPANMSGGKLQAEQIPGVNSRVNALASVNDGLVVATNTGLFLFENENVRQISKANEPYFSVTRSGNRLLAGSIGIIREFQIGDKIQIRDIALNLSGQIIHIKEFDNHIWLTSHESVYVLNPENDEILKSFGTGSRVQSMAVWRDTLWVGFNDGIRKVNKQGGEYELISPEYLPYFADSERQFFRLAKDYDDSIWARADRQIVQIHFDESSQSLNISDSEFTVIGRGSEINVIYPEEQSVWFGGMRGMYRLDKSKKRWESPGYEAHIREVLVRNDSLIFGGFATPGRSTKKVLPYRDNELRFEYSSASYVWPEQTQYQVWLENFDEGWSNWTSETRKDYTNISEGSYIFHVRAKNIHGEISETASYAFAVLPPWYRTMLAYIFYLFAMGLVFYLFHKARIDRILKEQRIRNRIAGDLHDEVSATLSSISFFAQALSDERAVADRSKFVNLIYESAGEAKEKITDIVWAINPEHDDWKAFLSKCRRFASDVLESKNMKYNLNIDENFRGKPEMQLRQHLWMMFKEMVTNAVRHSQAERLDVIMKFKKEKLEIIVQDDGKGMENPEINAGNGLNNIRSRAEKINADLKLETEPGMGTRWIITVSV